MNGDRCDILDDSVGEVEARPGEASVVYRR